MRCLRQDSMTGPPTETPYFSALYGPEFGQSAGDPVAAGQIFPLRSTKNLPRVLVVDDESLLRWSLREMLGDAGFEVVEARNGREARAAIADVEHPIDVMLVDLELPDVDGLQLVREARSRCPTCPVLIMTAYRSAETIDSALSAGATSVIGKPFDLDDVMRMVLRVCPPSAH
jgi:two-component system, NtrC family, nitrogen regulation response regulator GlnG